LGSAKFLSALYEPEVLNGKRNTEALEIGASQLAAGRVLSYTPARAIPLQDVRERVRESVVMAKAADLARQDGADKLAQWKKSPPETSLSAPVVVSREQTQSLPPTVVQAALRAATKPLPAWVGVDLGVKGYTVVKVNQVTPPSNVAQAAAKQNRDQYAQWWTNAESAAYLAGLKQRFKAEILVPNPSKVMAAQP